MDPVKQNIWFMYPWNRGDQGLLCWDQNPDHHLQATTASRTSTTKGTRPACNLSYCKYGRPLYRTACSALFKQRWCRHKRNRQQQERPSTHQDVVFDVLMCGQFFLLLTLISASSLSPHHACLKSAQHTLWDKRTHPTYSMIVCNEIVQDFPYKVVIDMKRTSCMHLHLHQCHTHQSEETCGLCLHLLKQVVICMQIPLL